MKKVLLGILGIIAYLLIPAIFGGIGAGVFFFAIKPQFEAEKILKYGIETKATITNADSKVTVSTTSGNTTRTEDYYNIKLFFYNSEGNKIEYKSRSIYPERFIRQHNIERGQTVQVMYVGAKAVVKGFVPKYETWLWLFPVVFGAIAVGFLIFLVIGILWTANDYIIKKFGTPVTGRYLEQKKLINDESNSNSIICTFRNDDGNTIKVKTRFVHTNSEAEELAKMGSFPIKYIGKKAIIMIGKNDKSKREKYI